MSARFHVGAAIVTLVGVLLCRSALFSPQSSGACHAYLGSSARDADQYVEWAHEYLRGLGESNKLPANLDGIEDEELRTQLRSYCEDHPEASVEVALVALVASSRSRGVLRADR